MPGRHVPHESICRDGVSSHTRTGCTARSWKKEAGQALAVTAKWSRATGSGWPWWGPHHHEATTSLVSFHFYLPTTYSDWSNSLWFHQEEEPLARLVKKDMGGRKQQDFLHAQSGGRSSTGAQWRHEAALNLLGREGRGWMGKKPHRRTARWRNWAF
jgi:hypothetical protein